MNDKSAIITQEEIDETLRMKAIEEARQKIIEVAREIANPKDMSQREYMTWDIEIKDILRSAVYCLDKLESKK